MDLPERYRPESSRRFVMALLSMPIGAWVASFVSGGLAGLPPFLAIQIASLTALAGVVPALILGLSAHTLLCALGWQRWPAYAATGMLVGSGFVLVVSGLGGGGPMRNLPIALLSGGLPGFGAALAFWATLRPDRSQDRG